MSDVFEAAPKVELHLHLEGAIPLPTLWEIMQAHGGDPHIPDQSALVERFSYRDFAHFIDTWWWMTGFLRTEADFTRLAESVASSLAAQRIVYAEASFSPTDFARHGLTPQQLGTAIRRGLDRVEGTRVVLNVDLVRDTGPDRASRTLDEVLEVGDDIDLRGVTIGGSEQNHPPEPFSAVYSRARDAGLRLTAHAGEAAGPGSVWGALRALGVERVGHGVRSVEDPALLDHLVETRVPLEVCPTSNLRTGVAPSWEDHQVHRLLEAGAVVTINSDDPTPFNCTLAGEFRTLAGHGVDMQERTLAAIDASWMTPDERSQITGEVDTWWAEHGGSL